MSHNHVQNVVATRKVRGKGPKGKRQLRLIRAEMQTEHERRNRASNKQRAQAKRQKLMTANTAAFEKLERER